MENINNLYEQANNKFELGDYKGAIEDYTKAININPNDPEVFINRGLAKYKLLDYQGAIEDYTKAISINPNDPEAFFNRGNVKLKLKDYQGAIVDYTKATKLNPDYSDAFFNMGVAKSKLLDYKGAIEDYTQIFKIKLKKNKRKEDIKRILKFRPLNLQTLHNLVQKEIWLDHPNKFNETFDRNIIQTEIKINSKTEILATILNNFLGATFVDELDSYKNGLPEEHNNSEEYSLFMWEHYCQNHTGICLIYEFSNHEKVNKELSINKITFKSKIYEPSSTDFFCFFEDGFFTQYKISENEHGFKILYLLENNKETVRIDGISIDLDQVGLELKEIIFGYKCSKKERKRIFEFINNINEFKHIDFYEMIEYKKGNYFKLNKRKYGSVK